MSGTVLMTGIDSAGDGQTEQAIDVTNGAAHVRDGAFTFRKDDTGTYTYMGEAAPGTDTSAASWQISRMTNADSTILYADGDGNFDNIWDNRASLSYS